MIEYRVHEKVARDTRDSTASPNQRGGEHRASAAVETLDGETDAEPVDALRRANACQWGPAWLRTAAAVTPDVQQSPAAAANSLDPQCSEPIESDSSASSPALPLTPTDADFDANEFYWASVCSEDYRYLTAPRSFPSPCSWCGGRLRHHPCCDDLRAGWVPTMPFGKHKGRKLSDVPGDYLRWLLTRTDRISPDLKAAIQEQLSCATDQPSASRR